MNDKTLNDFRNRIDLIDDQIVQLLEDRFTYVESIREHKKANHLAIEDGEREQSIMERIKKNLSKKYSQAIVIIVETIIKESKKMQK